jgi:hypothetical protein
MARIERIWIRYYEFLKLNDRQISNHQNELLSLKIIIVILTKTTTIIIILHYYMILNQ